MESTSSKILSFEEFVTKQGGEAGPELTPANTEFDQDTNPAPAEMPMGGEDQEHNLSVNMMDTDAEGNEPTGEEAPEADVEIEASADDVDAHADDNQ